jgi:hypothetical protein
MITVVIHRIQKTLFVYGVFQNKFAYVGSRIIGVKTKADGFIM